MDGPSLALGMILMFLLVMAVLYAVRLSIGGSYLGVYLKNEL